MNGRCGRHVASCRQALLRFRPIAPKPASSESFSGGISPGKSHVFAAGKRVKRKYLRVRKDGNTPAGKRRNNSSGRESETLTLQLMPAARSDGRDAPESGSGFVPRRPICGGPEARVSPPDHAKVVVILESCVTVEEHVSDACMEARGLGGTDRERVRALERDACPGFLSDGALSKVEWVNNSYRRMVAASLSAGEASQEIRVRLSAASKLGFRDECPGFFTCRVRVQNYPNNNNNNNNNNNGKIWKIMPCDVWRLDCGGFAWRLDVDAALGLGL